jgi:hypothetical protein
MNMLGRILVALLMCALLVFGIIWIMGGGLTRALAYARTISNPLDLFAGNASGESFKLPGQPELVSGPDIGLSAGTNYENAILDTDSARIRECARESATHDPNNAEYE